MVMLVMLVIMIVGAATVLVSSLGSSAITIERDKTTASALAQAREALIGYAISDSNHPGSLPCPDVDDDGKLTMNVDYVGSSCVSLIGRLPWKTLGLSELRDGTIEHLWYAVSKPFAAIGTPHINSDTQGTLTISGTSSASNVIAIVFAPGAAINSTHRSPSATAACPSLKDSPDVAQSWCATNYLEGSNTALSTWATPNLAYQSADTSSTFNDRMIFITHQNLMPLIEKRIAREVRSCLDGYALSHSSTYPWAAPVDDTSNYAGTTNTLFGRLPANAIIYNANVQLLLDDIAALQIALNNYSANPDGTTTRNALIAAGLKLYSDANGISPNNNPAPPLTSDDIAKAKDAGDKAQPPHIPAVGADNATVQAYVDDFQLTEINLTLKNFAESGVTPGGWPMSCTLIFSPYWPDWRNMVFYQTAAGYAPGSSGSCGSACITINGSGNTAAGSGTYRAAVIMAGKKFGSQTRIDPAANPPDDYLANTTSENSSDPSFVTNAHNNATLTTTFITYRPSDPYYQTVNDLVLCLDGGSNCK